MKRCLLKYRKIELSALWAGFSQRIDLTFNHGHVKPSDTTNHERAQPIDREFFHIKWKSLYYKFIFIIAFFILCVLPFRSVAAQLAVVVNHHNEIEALTRRQVSDIYMGRRRTFPTGEPVQILEQGRNSEIRANFFRLLNGMSLKRLNAYWARLQFSGSVQPPSEIPDSKTVRELVGQNKDAIGYIEASQVDDSVRVILLLKYENE